MTLLFDIDGQNLDIGFVNIKAAASPAEEAMRDQLEAMWAVYEPFADPDFRHGFARDVDARLWEMFLGCTLLEAGRTLLPVSDRLRQGGQPDLCVVEEGRRIWIEAIAPTEGDPGPDQIVRPVPLNEGGGFFAAPVRQAQLRTSGAFWTKAGKIGTYLHDGVIGPDDVRIVAIGASRFGAYVAERPLPLIMTTLFPLGAEYITIDRATGAVVGQGYQHAPEIERAAGAIPRTAFLDPRFSDISGVIWSRWSIGAPSREVRPITYVHNPLAKVPLEQGWGVWDREFVTTQPAAGEGWETTDILAPTANPDA